MERMSHDTTDQRDLDAAPEGLAPVPPLTTTTSIRPAMSVLLIGLVLLVGFLILDGVFGSPATAPPPSIVVVNGLATAPDNAVLAGCITPSNPPEDVSQAYLVPVGTVRAGTTRMQSNDPGGYDCTVRLFVKAPKAQVLGFYAAHFESQGWKVISTGMAAGGGGEQELYERASSDTFYWVAGVTIVHSTPSSTTWNLRFYQDDSFV